MRASSIKAGPFDIRHRSLESTAVHLPPSPPLLTLLCSLLLELYRAAVVINGFNLSAAEVSYFQTHASDFSGFDWNAVTLPQWLRLQAYTQLRNSLPRSDKSLLDLFQWIPQPGDSLAEEIAAVRLALSGAPSSPYWLRLKATIERRRRDVQVALRFFA